CEVVTKGHTAKIYLVSDDVVIKVNNLLPSYRFEREFGIQKELYSAGYPVAHPYNFYPIVDEQNNEIDIKEGISMERIYGTDLEEMVGNVQDLMEEAASIFKDINKKLGLGIRSWYGLSERNVMFDERRNRVVLIDFGHWHSL
ncbi:MAG: hypothetical protein OEL89_00385, partial [Candidatus Peregrinibacteria bacterium]|nr:hypothetical protein [Candidatus Peregrinibacteria bacterium]